MCTETHEQVDRERNIKEMFSQNKANDFIENLSKCYSLNNRASNLDGILYQIMNEKKDDVSN